MTTETLDTKSADARSCVVPLSKLIIHPDNVRRTDKRADVESLAASIAAHGLLQNLSVVRGEDDRYAVVAGGRRLAALRLLARRGAIARDFAVPCAIVDVQLGAEASLAENVQRVAMNAMDEMEAFASLADGGLSVDVIASRFGATIRHVEQRMALGRLSPKLRAAYRKAEITLDVARAFCLTDDTHAQERVFKQFGKPITHAASVRAALAGGRIPATDKLVRFVGIDAYEAAGGRLMRDLFDQNVVFLDDGDILQRLAGERVEALRQEVSAEGWRWVEVQLQHGLIEGCAPERLRPTARKLSRKETKTVAALEAEIELLDQELADAEEDDARWQKRDDAEVQLDAIRQSALRFDKDLMAHAGAIIAIDQSGAPLVTRGLIKRVDLKTVRKLQKASTNEADDETEDNCSDQPTGPAGPRLPKTLVEELTTARTRALRDQLAKSPQVALALMVHVLRQRSVETASVPGVAIVSHPVGYEDVDEFEHTRLKASEPLSDAGDALADLIAAPYAVLGNMLAAFVAETLQFSHQAASPQDGKLQRVGDTLASALDLDMKRYWEASVDFWERAPKAFILDALADAPAVAALPDAARKARLTSLAKLKKAELARVAAKTLQATGWLPDELITPPRRGALAVTPQGEAALPTLKHTPLRRFPLPIPSRRRLTGGAFVSGARSVTDTHVSIRRDIAGEITAKILAHLSAGVMPWRKPWDGARTGLALPRRAIGETYRGVNVILLWCAAVERGYRSPYWLTFNQALKLGACVRKGERGELVVYYGQGVRKRIDDAGGEIEDSFRFLKSYVVFSADQIDNLPEQFFPTPIAYALANTAHEAWFSKLEITRILTRDLACYIPSKDVIGMPPLTAFDTGDDYAATLNHESVHATMAAHRVGRDMGKKFSQHALAAEELVAEIGAAILGAHLNMPPHHIHDHAAYIGHWMKLLAGDNRAFLAAAAQAQTAVDWLLTKSPSPFEQPHQARDVPA